jgi:curved DNA-binding protein
MPVQFKDYYETLGVPKTATKEEIQKAFRKLARQYHPDVAKDKKTAEEKFKEINEAYEVLGDPEKRKKYDELGAGWDRTGDFQPPPGWQGFGGQPGGMPGAGPEGFDFHFGGTGFSDFFEAFFGGMGGPGRSGGGFGFEDMAKAPGRGQDVEADIMVTLEEALNGSKRRISFRRNKNAEAETYNVRIPAGVHEGQRIRLAGAGGAGTRGGPRGDVYLRVRFAQHPDFRVEGSDLIHEVQLAPWQAVLGGEVSVPTLEGSARLKIPPGTQNHRRFRLRERGLPAKNGHRGDLYAVVDVALPERLTERQRELWEQLAREAEP